MSGHRRSTLVASLPHSTWTSLRNLKSLQNCYRLRLSMTRFDFILRFSDGVNFQTILSLASPVFADMFNIPTCIRKISPWTSFRYPL